ncbi:unnamed protein product [Lota lota]
MVQPPHQDDPMAIQNCSATWRRREHGGDLKSPPDAFKEVDAAAQLVQCGILSSGGWTRSCDIVKLLLETEPRSTVMKELDDGVIVAVKGGFPDVVKERLKRNPNVNMTDKDGNTALMIAAKEGHTGDRPGPAGRRDLVNNPDGRIDGAVWAVEKGNATMVRDILQCT